MSHRKPPHAASAKSGGPLSPPGTRIAPRQNLGPGARGLSVVAGAALGAAATQQKQGGLAALFGIVGSLLVVRGLTGAAPVKRLIGQAPDERAAARGKRWSNAALLSRAVTINAPRASVFARLRDFPRWPDFSETVQHVEPVGPDLWRWTAKDPTGPKTWTGSLADEHPDELIALTSDGDTPVPIDLRFKLRDAPGGRGTEVHAIILYHPPGGSLARYAAKLTQKEPGVQLRRDLKRLKSLIETGEIATNAPQGTAPKA